MTSATEATAEQIAIHSAQTAGAQQ